MHTITKDMHMHIQFSVCVQFLIEYHMYCGVCVCVCVSVCVCECV